MKKTAFLLAIALCFAQCAKKESKIDGGSISANVNSVPFASTNAGVVTGTSGGITYYSFSAEDYASASLPIIYLILPNTQNGTYPFANDSSGPGINYYMGSKSYFTHTPGGTPAIGSIIIDSSTSTTISGTFSGVLYNPKLAGDSVVITNGVFTNLYY